MTAYNVVDNTYATSSLPQLNAGDLVIQREGTLITGGGSAAMQSDAAANITLVLNGMITGSRAVDVGAGSRMSIGETGHLASYNLYAIGQSGSGNIVNHGLVEHITGGAAVYFYGSANSDYVKLSNAGSIYGIIQAASLSTGDQLTINNTGLISNEGGNALYLNNETDVVMNRGTILGAVYLGGGSDTFNTSEGTVIGFVEADAGDDTLKGSLKSDDFSGGAGNDTLSGGAGADVLSGDADIDTLDYRTSNAAVKVNILSNTASGGHAQGDTIQNFENVSGSDYSDTMYGSNDANSLFGFRGNDKIYGGAGADNISGGEGNDLISGGAGADSMSGGAGNDIYYVDDVGDTIFEAAASGLDSVRSSITFTLAADIENLALTGSAKVNATGNTAANVIAGNSAQNVLGGGGGADTFVFNTKLISANYDIISDFSSDDVYNLDNAVFLGMTTGALSASAFKLISSGTSTVGVDASDRILYDKANGNLYFDRDGSGAEYGRIKFASVTDNLTLSHSDFLIV